MSVRRDASSPEDNDTENQQKKKRPQVSSARLLSSICIRHAQVYDRAPCVRSSDFFFPKKSEEKKKKNHPPYALDAEN